MSFHSIVLYHQRGSLLGINRDWLIGNITQTPVPTANLTNTTTYAGSTQSNGYTYHTDIRYVSGMLGNTNLGINHNFTVSVDGVNAVDGLVAVLDVRIMQSPPESSYVLPFLLSSFFRCFVELS